jgi:hypothetical protein
LGRASIVMTDRLYFCQHTVEKLNRRKIVASGYIVREDRGITYGWMQS